jgi:hypothetical protein
VAFEISEFLHLRPFVYHVTDRANLPRLQTDRGMRPAESWLADAKRRDLLGTWRPDSTALPLDGGVVVLKDQKPLIEANTLLTGGWTFGDFVTYLNRHVFFWPGRADGPIGPGSRLLQHYEAEGPAVLRLPTAELLAVNSSVAPLFCAFNSGSPRCQHGERVPRGPNLFTSADRFPRRASQVVELTFAAEIRLPASTELRADDGWVSLFEAGG